MNFKVKIDLSGGPVIITWSDSLAAFVDGPEQVLSELKWYSRLLVEGKMPVGPEPRGKKADDWGDPYAFVGCCVAYNEQFNPDGKVSVVGDMPPIDDLPPGTIY